MSIARAEWTFPLAGSNSRSDLFVATVTTNLRTILPCLLRSRISILACLLDEETRSARYWRP